MALNSAQEHSEHILQNFYDQWDFSLLVMIVTAGCNSTTPVTDMIIIVHIKIVARDPSIWTGKIQDRFLLKHVGSPSYYLGNDYHYSEVHNGWQVGCKTYLDECIRRVEKDNLFGINGVLYKHKTPLPPQTQPELDT